jgi:hypothetical protein
MKISFLITISLLICRVVYASPDEGQTLAPLNWVAEGISPLGPHLPPQVQASIENPTESDEPETNELKVQYTGTSPLQLKLEPTPWNSRLANAADRISTHHFAITGQVRYENVAPGSYLEMKIYFDSPAPGYAGGTFFSRTMAESGPMGKLYGTCDWRQFSLPYDSTGTNSRVNHLEMYLHLAGAGTVHFRNMELMQYPDAPAAQPASPTIDRVKRVYLNGHFPTSVTSIRNLSPSPNPPEPATILAAQNVSPPATASEGIHWRSFFLGMGATGLALLVIVGLILLSRLWQHYYHERELRRIASLDS